MLEINVKGELVFTSPVGSLTIRGLSCPALLTNPNYEDVIYTV